jgi:hypothetical protein
MMNRHGYVHNTSAEDVPPKTDHEAVLGTWWFETHSTPISACTTPWHSTEEVFLGNIDLMLMAEEDCRLMVGDDSQPTIPSQDPSYSPEEYPNASMTNDDILPTVTPVVTPESAALTEEPVDVLTRKCD